MATYRYRITKNAGGSAKYGKCEVCKKNVAGNMYHQMEEKAYVHDGKISWTQHECHDLFGHKSCLLRKRRNQTWTG